MITLEYPSKRSAKEYCLQNEKCRRATSNQDDYNDDDNDFLNYDDDKFHHGFNPHTYNVPKDGLTVGKSTAGENAGRGVFVNTNGDEEDDNIVPPHSFLNLEVTAHPVRAHWTTTEIIVDMDEEHDIYADFNDILSYLDGYGYIDQPWGEPQYTVESGILTFVNHGCNGTFNIGLETNFTELSVDLDNIPSREDLKLNAYDHMATYDPIEERQILLHQITVQTHRHETLYKGDELFDNYLGYGGMEYLELNIKTLREECSGAVGFVEQEQNKAKEGEEEQQQRQQQLQVEEDSSMNDDDDEEDDDDNAIRTIESNGGENNNSDDFAVPVPTAPATTTLEEDDKDESSSTTSEPLCVAEESNGVGKTG